MSAMSIGHPPGRAVTAADPDQFRRDYNRTGFLFRHCLAGHALFELDSLVALTRRMPNQREHSWFTGPLAVDNTWSDGTIGRQSLQDTITNIRYNNSSVVLRRTEQDPVFAPILQDVLATIVELTGQQLRADVRTGEVSIIVSSPRRMAPYRLDTEPGFILQIAGEKCMHLAERTADGFVTDRELENFFAAGTGNGPPALRRPDCGKHELHAGLGLHIPTFAPYWAQNHDTVSVALKVGYALQSVERLEKLHRFNHRLRRLGLRPTTPTLSPYRDRVKLAVTAAAAATVRFCSLYRVVPRPRAAWKPPAN